MKTRRASQDASSATEPRRVGVRFAARGHSQTISVSLPAAVAIFGTARTARTTSA